MKSFWSRCTHCLLLTFISAHFIAAQPPDRQPDQPAARWVVKAGNPILIERTGEPSGLVVKVVFSPDGSLLATAGGDWKNDVSSRHGVVLLWDARTGAARGQLTGHADILQNLAYSPDGKKLATQSQDGAIFLWDTLTNKLLHRLSQGLNQAVQQVKDPRDMAAWLHQPRLRLGAWSPDGKTLASYEVKYDLEAKPPRPVITIKLFDVASGKIVRTLPSTEAIIYSLDWTADGKSLLVTSRLQREDKTSENAIEVVDAHSGEVRRRLANYSDGPQYVGAISRDARYAVLFRPPAVGADHKRPTSETALLWDLENDRPVWTQTLPHGSLRNAAFSRDGKSLVAANADGEVVVRDTSTGETRQTLPATGCATVSSLALSGDGQRIAFTEEGSSIVTIWKLDEPLPKPRYTSRTIFREAYNVRALAWPTSGLHAVSEISTYQHEKGLSVGQELRIDSWAAPADEAQSTTIPDKRVLGGGMLSPDGKLLAIEVGTQPKPAYFDTEGIAIYDLQAGKLLRVLPEDFGVSSIAWSPDGTKLATNIYNDVVTLWNVAGGEVVSTLDTKADSVAWSPDGSTLATGSGAGRVQLFNAETGQQTKTWQTQGSVRTLAFAPDGKTLAVGATLGTEMERGDSFVRLFDIETGNQTQAFKTQAFKTQRVLRAMHWTPDGKAIAASSYPDPNRASNGQLRVWDAASGEERVAIDDRCGAGDFAFSPDGTQVALHNWNRMRVWKLGGK